MEDGGVHVHSVVLGGVHCGGWTVADCGGLSHGFDSDSGRGSGSSSLVSVSSVQCAFCGQSHSFFSCI